MANPNEAKSIVDDFHRRSNEILKDSFVRDSYEEYCSEKINQYLLSLAGIGNNLIFRILNKLSGYRLGNYWVKKKYLPKKREVLINMLECEAHRELILQGLKNDM
jgi:poly-gamma-glutamate synthesis protein (capsule biosynthesis protein)